jgi:dipeptidase D
MGPIQEYMTNFGKNLGLETIKDQAGNIIIRKPATKGMEKRPSVVLQSHLDMVPQKNSHVQHDFSKDSIKPRLVDGWVYATDTTLGADNGIGVAAIMAVLAADALEHGPIEALFTIDEETGMDGAFALNSKSFEGRTLINLDSEDEGELFVGCAGGVNVNAAFSYNQLASVPDNHVAYSIALTGLKGGHSGVDIHLGRANANKLMFHFLKQVVRVTGVRLASYKGGTLRNAIPREAFAVITLPETEKTEFEQRVKSYEKIVGELFSGIEDTICIKLSPAELPEGLLPEEVQDDVINAMVAVHNGVLRYIPELPETVETSSNLSIVETKEGEVLCQFLARSASSFMMDQLVSTIQSTCSLAGAKVSTSGKYPGWMPNLQSHLMDVSVESYERLFGVKPAVNVIHAGLECGIIQDGVGKMEMISFGPTICFPHSPDEKVEVASVERFWTYLTNVLGSI